MKPEDALREYLRLAHELNGAKALNPIQDSSPEGVIPKGLIKGPTIHEPEKLLRFATLAAKLNRARAKDQQAFKAFALSVVTGGSVRRTTKIFNRNPLKFWSRKKIQALIDTGRSLVGEEVNELQ